MLLALSNNNSQLNSAQQKHSQYHVPCHANKSPAALDSARFHILRQSAITDDISERDLFGSEDEDAAG